jgi:ParB family chromosome partitioning protein
MTEPASTIDEYVDIHAIRIVDRHRRDVGDLQALADSIIDVGLINPVTLTRDLRLVAGQRRMEACRLIGVDTVPVRFVDNLNDAAKLLRAERDENVCRKDMLPSELAALGESLLAIEAPAANERRREAQERGRATQRGVDSGDRSLIQLTGQSRDAVGEALGMSGRTYSELRGAYQLANDPEAPAEHRQAAREALDKMDRGEGIWLSRRELREKLSGSAKPTPTPEPEPETGDVRNPDWIPKPNEKGREAVARRRELIAEYGRTGWTSGQIGDRLGILPETIRKIARGNEITITADVALGRSHKRIDSSRIIREIVQDLDNLEMSLALVRFAELDRAEIQTWTTSLSKSIRVLNRLTKRLKEIDQ